MAKTNAERQQEYRDRKAAESLVEFRFHAHASNALEVRKEIKKLAEKYRRPKK